MAEKKAKKTTKTAVVTQSETTVAEAGAGARFVRPGLHAPLAACAAELVGTFMLAAVVIVVSGQQLFVMFALITIVLVVGHLSGAHVNPAITFGAWITRNITGLRAIGYIVAQIIGALLAVAILTALLDKTPSPDPMSGVAAEPKLFTAAALEKGKEWTAFFAEILGALIFGFGVASALQQKERIAAAFAVGGSLFIGLLIGGATVVLNPAVAMSIQALKLDMWTASVYALATFIGSALGFVLYKVVGKYLVAKS